MLDERKASILRAVVQEYIDTAQPVGSKSVAGVSGVEVSPATVRNEMAALERDGYLAQPHTSAGRIPTDKGYRFFVDSLTPKGTLVPGQRQKLRHFFEHTHSALEQMLNETSRLLSDLTSYAAVVVGPPHEVATIRSVQLVGLGSRLALLVVVLSNGVVEKRSIEMAPDTDPRALEETSQALAKHLVGRTLADVGTAPEGGGPAVAQMVAEVVATLGTVQHDEPDHVFVGGASRMATAFDAVQTVRQVLATLEQQYLVVNLLENVLDRGLSVAIGAEHGVEPLAECSVVVAPYEVEGEQLGTIGVVGPTRMQYPQALAAVALVSERLGRRLTEG
ncbi:MAG TPA: heat-inducible transcriptional repressor HrcA [Acidimicrobiales bacterium]|nr:heat-inducible transcriptional repressor HrcA [Acidimicrobiales bacterium]